MQNGQRTIWFDGRNIPFERQDIWSLVNQSPLEMILVTMAQRKTGYFPQKTTLVTEIENRDDLLEIPAGEIIYSSNPQLLQAAQQQGFKTCIFLAVEDRAALEKSWQEASKYDYAVVDFDLPTNIPLELIIARLQNRSVVILRKVESFTDMEVAFGVLEQGSDGVLLAGAEMAEIQKVIRYLSNQVCQQVKLYPLVVNEVRHIGMGARACIDTTSLMSQEEGMLIGSTSGGGIFVCSETHYLPYMNLRPFRVNAGAVHSYVWMPDDTAEYITDLKAGSKVLCVNTRGETREITVGRMKIEVRPLLLIKGEANGRELNVIVQDDWHIRLMGSDGLPRNATKIQPGEELLAYISTPGRHVGISVNETIIEK
ncbi:MAG: 3-dehydroquinate synthase II [Syntrophomonadaceae bacterium]|jgi:3-amino-4-hydroxybenzoic acid synthase